MSSYLSSVANYLYILTNVSWVKEVRSITLPKEFMDKHGLKGSPKLSKQLLNLGLSHQQVSFIMDLFCDKATPYKLWENGESPEIAVRLQGNSTHFQTCQAVTDPFDSTCWEGNTHHCKIKEDLEAYKDNTLSFVTIGNPINQDNIGWVSRVKLRGIYKKGVLKGYLADRTYGRKEPILQAFDNISQKKQLPIYGSVQFYSSNNKKVQIDGDIPSKSKGYQDTKSTKGNFVELCNISFLCAVYKSRLKEKGVYSTPVSKGLYNPQTGKTIESFPKNSNLVRAFKYWGLEGQETEIKIEKGYIIVDSYYYKQYCPIFYKRLSGYLQVYCTDREKGYAYALPSNWLNNGVVEIFNNPKIDCSFSLYTKVVFSPLDVYTDHSTGLKVDLRDSTFEWETHSNGWAEPCPINLPELIKGGYDDKGYSPNGEHLLGYDSKGFDVHGRDRKGFDRYGIDREGYNLSGFNSKGYNRKGYTRHGYDRDGYNCDGYDRDGYDRDGYNRKGYNPYGYDRNGYDSNGYDHDGYDRDGYDHSGYNLYGYDRDGYDSNGYDRHSYDRDGYNRYSGYNRQGYDRDGYDRAGNSPRLRSVKRVGAGVLLGCLILSISGSSVLKTYKPTFFPNHVCPWFPETELDFEEQER